MRQDEDNYHYCFCSYPKSTLGSLPLGMGSVKYQKRGAYMKLSINSHVLIPR